MKRLLHARMAAQSRRRLRAWQPFCCGYSCGTPNGQRWPRVFDRPCGRCSPAAVLLRLASLIVSALRWQALLEPAAHVPLRGVVAVTHDRHHGECGGADAGGGIGPAVSCSTVRRAWTSPPRWRRPGMSGSSTGSRSWRCSSRRPLWLHAAGKERRVAARRSPPAVAAPVSRVSALRAGRLGVAAADPGTARVAVGSARADRLPVCSRSSAACARSIGRRGVLSVVAYSALLAALTAIERVADAERVRAAG